MSDNVEEEVKHQEISADERPVPAPASFAGRLNLASYAFVPESSTQDKATRSPVRRSPRNTPSVSSSSSPSPSKRSLKREASDSTLLRPSVSPKKRSRSAPSGYAHPSTYSHLAPLTDILAPNLILIFVGLNPGVMTSSKGHAYAHPSNLFWKLLHSSGITSRRLLPSEDVTLPEKWSCGNTNIVSRPTRNGSELSKSEMDEGVSVLEEKVRKSRPEAVVVVGKSIWESLFRVRNGRGLKKGEFEYGWQDGEMMGVAAEGDDVGQVNGSGEEDANDGPWEGARIFVASSTSGLAATLSPAEKERIWGELGSWVQQRRAERLAAAVE
ncbi:uncharacterized protein BP5553_08652 [Venustampulla echinocandica]|uniref:Uracil-DNA glycosylase-like domain-containing protein n=1 Tax=Venustampulla echinocandica TaxID=2656787 RepID=A0A370TEU9_9HELO|nr:uncharacterized protein BP5553_08652 [Venustampulla echinocandica]RDL33213.1 hypothetical protein BP5553_08652 [Venustampulla echinocandica]